MILVCYGEVCVCACVCGGWTHGTPRVESRLQTLVYGFKTKGKKTVKGNRLREIYSYSCNICHVHISQVEKNRACMKLTTNHFPESCHFMDILDLVQNPPSEDCWNPSKLVLVKEAYCQTHKKMSFDDGWSLSFFWFGQMGFKRSV